MSNPTDQDYDCLQHARVQTQLLRRLTDHSNLDFGKELIDFESEAHRWIDETAKKIAEKMEKQLDVIDLAFVVLWPSETEKVRLIMAPDDSVAEVLYYPNGKPGTDGESREETPVHPELSLGQTTKAK